jgi:hypothetical protein
MSKNKQLQLVIAQNSTTFDLNLLRIKLFYLDLNI